MTRAAEGLVTAGALVNDSLVGVSNHAHIQQEEQSWFKGTTPRPAILPSQFGRKVS